MIKHIDALLISWAENMAGGYGAVGCCGGFSVGAVTRLHPRRVVRDEFGSRVAELTARGCETRVVNRVGVSVSGAAMDMDRAVSALPGPLRDAVRVFYFDGGLALAVRAKKLGISVATMYKRLGEAHLKIDEHLYGRRVA